MVDDHFRAKLIGFLQELHAHETEIAKTLQRQIDSAADVPEVRTRLVQHMAESEVQKTRLADRLAAYDQKPSIFRDATSTLKGNLVGITGALLLWAGLLDGPRFFAAAEQERYHVYSM